MSLQTISNFNIHKKSVDLSEDCVIHLLQILEISLDLTQIPINCLHLVPHVVLNRNTSHWIERGKNLLPEDLEKLN